MKKSILIDKKVKIYKWQGVKGLRYFILSLTNKLGYTSEYYLKGISMDYMKERVSRYSNGVLATTKVDIVTSNFISGDLREINLRHFSHLSKKDFAVIDELESYDVSNLINQQVE